MLFSSLFFIYFFLPLCMVMTLMTSKIKVQNWILLIFSLFFYAWGEPFWVLLMVGTGAFTWLMGFVIDRSDSPVKRRSAMIAATVVMLGSLGIFKYTNFFVEQLNVIPFINIPSPEIRLPIGISFYTFQVLTYIIDLYRGEVKLQRKLHKFLLYQTLFPQLIAGPIVRYSDIAYQIDKRTISLEGIKMGAGRFLVGLAKKVILANGVGQLVDQTMQLDNLGSLTGIAAWAGLISFAFQIYFDFSGYSDMAIGMGQMFGFHFKENFNYPYIATSITEFWRRWHISLSSFFRDYVYIPLGGNRQHQLRNMFVVWALTGFWHGASWNFILWGVYFFVLLAIEKTFLLKILGKVPQFIGFVYGMFTVLMGWVLFYFTDLGRMGEFTKQLFRPTVWVDDISGTLVLSYGFLLIACAVASTPIVPWVRARIAKHDASRIAQETAVTTEDAYGRPIQSDRVQTGGQGRIPEWLVRLVAYFDEPKVRDSLVIARNIFLLLICTANLAGSTFNPFLYFRF